MVRVHVMLSVIALQARALAFPAQMRECVRAVAFARDTPLHACSLDDAGSGARPRGAG